MCTFRDELRAYTDLDAQVLGISIDSPFSLKMWQEKNNYNFPLLSDFNKEAATAIRRSVTALSVFVVFVE